MTVIALAGNKGGSGKTTLAINLASALSRHGSVIILDADPQGSCVHWYTATDGYGSVPVLAASDEVSDVVAFNLGVSDYLVIDCPPSVHAPQTLAALVHADVVLIPVIPSPLDIWAGLHVTPVVEQVKNKNPGLQAQLVINQLEPQTRLSQLARQALDEVGLPTAATALRRRMAYRRAMLEGRSVMEMGKRGADAAREIEQLTAELVN